MNRHRLLAIAICFLSASVLSAAEPQFSSISPVGMQRGTEIEVTLSGDRLQDFAGMIFYTPGLSLKEIKPLEDKDKPKKAVAVLVADSNCRLGMHAIRLRTDSGISNMQTFYVGALPEIEEKEPNSDFTAPQPIEMNVVVNGIVQSEDEDFFVVEAKKGQRIVAELEGLRIGRTNYDPYLAILNEQRFELVRSDDSPLLYQDSVCSLIAPEDGRYILQIRESSYGGNGAANYRLHVGEFPRPLGVYPGGGRPGEEVEVTMVGDAGGETKTRVKLPDTPGIFQFFAQDDKGIAPSPNRMRVIDIPNALEAEPNEDQKTASQMEAPGAANGVIGDKGDVDYFKFTAKKGEQYDVRVYAREPLRSPLDPVVNVYRSNGGGVGGNDDSGGLDSYYRLAVPEDGEYFVRVADHLQKGGPDFIYRIEITRVAPALTMGVPEVRQYISHFAEVPQGNNFALLVSAKRENWGGDLKAELSDLPPGVEYEILDMKGNQTTVPVLFKAAADAPLASALVNVTGRPVDENVKVTGGIDQRTMLIRGRNNSDVWGHNADRMTLAVTEKIPYKLEIIQPKVPIVRDGSMALKVKATRDEGFDGEISLRMLYNPPGIGSSGSIKIEKGKDEAEIPLTANGGAEIGDWKICVIGRAAYKSGAVEAATPFANLSIADRFFDFSFAKTAMEQGSELQYVIEVTKKTDFEGPAKVELLGLPNGATAEPVEITKDSPQAVFTVKATPETKDGRHKSIMARAIVMQNEEPITHTLGAGEIRVDKPQPKAVAPEPKKEEPKKEEPKKEAPPKPLSRLEQLRAAKEAAAAGK
ncbi:pre-peptidase C-terminal domain-containing protein [Blastopirellula sp. JC732]|uniref:Pre-peptidase C-terminal domain-containing protein n=1 Tax=Blastopirellula sediminis TaxID=2894196 RepID=A0A9X1MU51_9BACT|nr:pre-peptidase C-terminal domain-containing protein [Blastopirellula sediminis]MCC9605061.1 pre-peptidase C-terminal domain-containing protein [Blastopirellula sediminis]MCC9631639.1 pre-peptidase C-terminal domain-containing protein [Blastopirellula sediminis]